MSDGIFRKLWVTPLTALFFLAVAITGIVLLCEVKSHAVKELHELAGGLFAVCGLLHLVKNRRALMSYLKQSGAR